MLKSTKQKYNQHDLRRLMQEQKAKSTKSLSAEPKTKIDSPLAKYNDLGQLSCVLCQKVVRSEEVWKVHLNTKEHKENVIAARDLKHKVLTGGGTSKRPAVEPSDHIPEKKPKGILKNAHPQPPPTVAVTEVAKSEVSQTAPEPMEATEEEAATLPEGFFDDPKKDAIARNLEYKDPVQEEWDRFQKEIRDAATISNDIIAGDQEESTAERQIVEIDEQIRNWSRVLTMEKKKEETISHLEKFKLKAKKPRKDLPDDSDEDEDDLGADNLDEFGNWRAKGWNKEK